MREFPVFVPFEGEHLAAVVTAPPAEARGLVLLSTGLGAPRSHRHQVWALAAERLAARGMASVRFEYPGVHDSTGSAERVTVADLPTREAMEVARFALAATGAGRVVAVGNCWGAQLAVTVAALMDQCVGAVCVLPETVEPGSLDAVVRRAAGRRLIGILRSSASLRRLVRPVRRLTQDTSRALRGDLPQALGRCEVLFLYDSDHLEIGPHAIGKVRAMVDHLPTTQRERFELRILPGRGLARFGSVEVQECLLQTLVSWCEHRLQAPWPIVEDPLVAASALLPGSGETHPEGR